MVALVADLRDERPRARRMRPAQPAQSDVRGRAQALGLARHEEGGVVQQRGGHRRGRRELDRVARVAPAALDVDPPPPVGPPTSGAAASLRCEGPKTALGSRPSAFTAKTRRARRSASRPADGSTTHGGDLSPPTSTTYEPGAVITPRSARAAWAQGDAEPSAGSSVPVRTTAPAPERTVNRLPASDLAPATIGHLRLRRGARPSDPDLVGHRGHGGRRQAGEQRRDGTSRAPDHVRHGARGLLVARLAYDPRRMAGPGEPVVRGTERSELAQALPGYAIGGLLGRGAFAVVLAARHSRLERDVAVKWLSPELLSDPAARDRFATEARLLASLDHPHIVRVHDYVEHERVCALVMERLHGGTLAERRGRLSPARACALMVAALHGLEHAHRHGVLHRDVKPENLLFGERDVLKVADFGIARVVGAQGARLTATAAAIGTPAFMAPEQVSSSVGPLSSATDVWSAGAVLYELLAGVPPLPLDGDLGDVLLRRMTDEARPLRALAPDVPGPVADVVMRALARDPGHRYATAAGFAGALERAAGPARLAATGVPIRRTEPEAPRAGETVEAGAGAAARAGPAWAAPARPTAARPPEPGHADAPQARGQVRPAAPRRRRAWAVLAAVVAATGVGAGLAFTLSQGDEAPGPSAPGPARAAPPAPPPGWPRAVSLGYHDPLDGAAGAARRLGRGGLAYDVFGGDAAAREDWSHEPGPAVARRLRRRGAAPGPAAVRDLLPAPRRRPGRQGRRGRGDSQDAGRPGAHGRLLAQRPALHAVAGLDPPAGGGQRRAGRVGAARAEPRLRPARPDTVGAVVGASGLRELRGLPDNLPGVAQGWLRLRDRYAPEALLGFSVADYGTNVDLSRQVPPRATLIAAARDAGHFYIELAIFDFAGLEIAYSEEGQNPEPSRRVLTRGEGGRRHVRARVREDDEDADGARERAAGQRRDEDDRRRPLPLARRLGRVAHRHGRLLRAEPPARRRGHRGPVRGRLRRGRDVLLRRRRGRRHERRRRGTVATSADDDGGYLADRMAALRRSGGVTLAR